MAKGLERRSTEFSARKDGKAGVRPAGGPGSTAAAAQPGRSRAQMEIFEEAMRLFHSRKLREAKDLFAQAAAGPDRGVAHKAELQARMCERRLEQPPVILKTAEEHYNYAVALINSRDLGTAQKHLRAALELDPRGDHVYYALALCRGLAGDLHGAYENLKCAIDLQPRNRIAARQDVDFAEFAHQPPLDRLLFPEKKPAE